MLTAGLLTAGLRFCVGGRVWAVRGRESGQGVGLPGRGRDVGCFGGIVHWQDRWEIGAEYPEP